MPSIRRRSRTTWFALSRSEARSGTKPPSASATPSSRIASGGRQRKLHALPTSSYATLGGMVSGSAEQSPRPFGRVRGGGRDHPTRTVPSPTTSPAVRLVFRLDTGRRTAVRFVVRRTVIANGARRSGAHPPGYEENCAMVGRQLEFQLGGSGSSTPRPGGAWWFPGRHPASVSRNISKNRPASSPKMRPHSASSS